MTSFNSQNQGHKDGYPLFLGDDLGIIDTINTQYPKLEELYQLQVSQIWNENEIDLTQDRMDMLNVPSGTRELMVETLMFQTAADSIAARSIIESLGKYISNTELLNVATIWSFFEVIHARTYSHIIKQTFVEPNQMIEQLYNNVDVMNRLKVIKETFDVMENISDDASEYTKQCAILNTLTALFALEAIAFMSSFAVTFAITETGVFQGIGQLVKLICRDEVLHTRMDFEIFRILQNDPSWSKALEDTMLSRVRILDSVVDQEVEWGKKLFSAGRSVVGLNQPILEDYMLYMAKPIYDFMGYDMREQMSRDIPTSNPLPYMDSYIDSSSVQAAAQEIQLTNYNIGVVADDNLDDLEL